MEIFAQSFSLHFAIPQGMLRKVNLGPDKICWGVRQSQMENFDAVSYTRNNVAYRWSLPRVLASVNSGR